MLKYHLSKRSRGSSCKFPQHRSTSLLIYFTLLLYCYSFLSTFNVKTIEQKADFDWSLKTYLPLVSSILHLRHPKVHHIYMHTPNLEMCCEDVLRCPSVSCLKTWVSGMLECILCEWTWSNLINIFMSLEHAQGNKWVECACAQPSSDTILLWSMYTFRHCNTKNIGCIAPGRQSKYMESVT